MSIQAGGSSDQPVSAFNKPLFLLGFNAAIGGFLFGYDTSSMSASLLQIKRSSTSAECPGLEPRTLTIMEQEMVTSFVVLGAFLSAMAAGFLNSVLGRRKVLILGSFVFAIGSIMMGASHSLTTMLASRIIVGLGVGVSSHTVPLYISECAPSAFRGSLCFLNDMMIVVGQVIASVISTYLFFEEVPQGWRWILSIAAVPATLMFLGIWFAPESPRWLLSVHRKDEAKTVLQYLREGYQVQDVEEEYNQMIESVNAEMPLTHGEPQGLIGAFWKDVRVRRALLLGCGLQALQQWSGINTIMYYGATVLEKASHPTQQGDNCFSEMNKRDVACTVLFGVAQMFGVVVSWHLVDRVGRRPLILISLAGVILFLTSTGVAFSFEQVVSPLVVALVIGYLICFGIGMSPVPWTVNAEIYPLSVRAKCISVSTSTNWLMNFIVAQTFLTLSRKLSTNKADPSNHPNGVFWLYATISLCWFFDLFYRMPETRGLTLEEIGDLFASKPDPTKNN